MAGLKQIKTKIKSTEKTRKVTKAMEAVSAAKMRKAQNRALFGRDYARAATSILSHVASSRELSASHPLFMRRDSARVLYIVITSDKGLAGALNSAVLRAVHAQLGQYERENVGIIAVGRKANDFFSRRGYRIEVYHEHKEETVSRELVNELVSEAAHRFAGGEWGSVRIAYQNFISTFEQRPTLRTIFPLSLEELSAVVADIAPRRGLHAEAVQTDAAAESTSYEVEPSSGEVLDTILPKLASIFVYHALLESQASEHSARMVAMKSASEKGEELQHSLTLQFNKARQAAITREVSEITGGMEAMAG